MRLRRKTTCWSGLFLLPLLGCPSTNTAPIVIDRVELTSSRATEFEMKLIGRGFGLIHLSYDLDEGSGQAAHGTLAVRIANELFYEHTESGRAVDVVSPREINVIVVLSEPLPEGTYSVSLLDGEDVLATKEAAFEVQRGGGSDAGLTDAGRADAAQSDLGPRRDATAADVVGTDTSSSGPSQDARSVVDSGSEADAGGDQDAEAPDIF